MRCLGFMGWPMRGERYLSDDMYKVCKVGTRFAEDGTSATYPTSHVYGA
jgi:hypothetical protein